MKVVIFGVGDFARVAQTYLASDSPHEVVAFAVNERYIEAPELRGVPVVPFEGIEQSHPAGEFGMFVAIGFSRVNEARREVYEQCKELGYEMVSYLHSSVNRWEENSIGDNTFIFEENVVQPFVSIGSDTILWSGNHIGHDVTIGDHCFIASHAVISGNTKIGEGCFVGVNATFRDGITVAPRCIIGAGALVMKDTSEGDVIAPRADKPLEKKSWELDL
jgi:sugar O-acyltransferase (sialic acid O-acetyltransferase NeuD family)